MKYYQSRFNGVYSRDNLSKLINLDEYAVVGTHWTALYVKNNETFIYWNIYFDTFGVEHISKMKLKNFEYKQI